jgi:hypothetical protein
MVIGNSAIPIVASTIGKIGLVIRIITSIMSIVDLVI